MVQFCCCLASRVLFAAMEKSRTSPTRETKRKSALKRSGAKWILRTLKPRTAKLRLVEVSVRLLSGRQLLQEAWEATLKVQKILSRVQALLRDEKAPFKVALFNGYRQLDANTKIYQCCNAKAKKLDLSCTKLSRLQKIGGLFCLPGKELDQQAFRAYCNCPAAAKQPYSLSTTAAYFLNNFRSQTNEEVNGTERGTRLSWQDCSGSQFFCDMIICEFDSRGSKIKLFTRPYASYGSTWCYHRLGIDIVSHTAWYPYWSDYSSKFDALQDMFASLKKYVGISRDLLLVWPQQEDNIFMSYSIPAGNISPVQPPQLNFTTVED